MSRELELLRELEQAQKDHAACVTVPGELILEQKIERIRESLRALNAEPEEAGP